MPKRSTPCARDGVVATLARAWESVEYKSVTHGLATVATRKSRCDKALAEIDPCRLVRQVSEIPG